MKKRRGFFKRKNPPKLSIWGSQILSKKLPLNCWDSGIYRALKRVKWVVQMPPNCSLRIYHLMLCSSIGWDNGSTGWAAFFAFKSVLYFRVQLVKLFVQLVEVWQFRLCFSLNRLSLLLNQLNSASFWGNSSTVWACPSLASALAQPV